MRCVLQESFQRVGRLTVLAVIAVAATALGLPAGTPTPTGDVHAGGIGGGDWLGTANAYRAMSGLPPVASNSAWNDGTTNHSCYILTNGISHDEEPGRPRYSVSGDDAGNNSNVALAGGGATAQDFVEMWMTAPYHAIGLLRPGWRQTSYGECREQSAAGSRAGATLDVIRGTDFGVKNSEPILFPGRNSSIRLTRFIAEWPNPLEACSWTGTAGLPVIAMMPSKVSSATATIASPDGDNPTCTLSAGNAGHPVAQSILNGANAVVIVPRRPLANGSHTVSMQTDAGNVTWTFNVTAGADLNPVNGVPQNQPNPQPVQTTTIPAAPVDLNNAEVVAANATYQAISPARLVDSRVPLGSTRLNPGDVKRVRVAPSDVDAITANITAVNGSGGGYVTAYNCKAKPATSTVNFTQTRAIANVTHVGLDSGNLCLTASTAVDVIVDVTGYYRTGDSSYGYWPIRPQRIIDTRNGGVASLTPDQPIAIALPGGLVPNDVAAAVVNLTAVNPAGPGYITAYPCGSQQTTSNVNYRAGETVANSTVVPVQNDQFCVVSSTATDLIVDLAGYYANGSALSFSAVSPIRMFDSRSTQAGLNDATRGNPVSDTVRLRVAGVRGIPANTKVVNVNLTGVDPSSNTHLSAYSCDSGFSGTSNVNLAPGRGAIAGGAMVEVSSDGSICIKVGAPTHVVVDITGLWVP